MRGGQFFHWMKYHFGLEPAVTQTTDAERAEIARYASGCRHVVEIGVFEGVTSLVLRNAMDPAGTLTCVDPFPPGVLGISYGYSISRREVSKSDNGSVRFLRCLSHEAAVGWNVPVDFLFLDGDHSEEGVLRDWGDWGSLVASGGFVAFHDSVAPEGVPGPPALVRKIRSKDPTFEFVSEVDSLTIFRRCPKSMEVRP